MNLNNLSAKKICRLVSAGMVFSMLVITGIFGGIMQDIRIFIVGGTLTLCAFFWIWLLVLIFGKRLSHFTSNLCRTLDNMIDGNEELQKSNDSETLFARINHRLIRLYEIMQKNRHKVDMASSKEYLEFVLEQLAELDEITYRAMMGEYIIYYRGKIVGGIYDDRLLVKPIKSAISYMPTATYELPYDGAREMLLVEDVDNKKFLTGLFNAMYDELSAPKIKKKK